MTATRILVTRERKSAQDTAQNLIAAGLEPVLMPFFEVVDTGLQIPEGSFDGVVFTSRNAVEIFAQRGFEPSKASNFALCVGEKTAELARRMGFTRVLSANGGGAKLAEQINSEPKYYGHCLLYPTTAKRAFDLQSALIPAAITLTLCEIYNHQEISPDQKEISDGFGKHIPEYAFVYSMLSGKHFAQELQKFGGNEIFVAMNLVAISKNAAQGVLSYPWRNVYVANQPNEFSMIDRVNKLSLA
ncbi:MAG: uroporphyrinogen-III synthase [Pseudomonadota bacterium]